MEKKGKMFGFSTTNKSKYKGGEVNHSKTAINMSNTIKAWYIYRQ